MHVLASSLGVMASMSVATEDPHVPRLMWPRYLAQLLSICLYNLGMFHGILLIFIRLSRCNTATLSSSQLVLQLFYPRGPAEPEAGACLSVGCFMFSYCLDPVPDVEVHRWFRAAWLFVWHCRVLGSLRISMCDQLCCLTMKIENDLEPLIVLTLAMNQLVASLLKLILGW